jgi:hypothetical protein
MPFNIRMIDPRGFRKVSEVELDLKVVSKGREKAPDEGIGFPSIIPT